MKILRFTLSGQTAFFKKPEVNTYYYFTYGNIHRIALLGMFGAVLGYGGYTQMSKPSKKKKELEQSYPEFYERLCNLHIAVTPNAPKGFFHKKVQVFNNSVGYASKEQGGNLIVKEQWLEQPSWEIQVLIDSEEAEKLADALMGHRCVYVPYLGKNDHYADIKNVRILEAEERPKGEGVLTSLFLKDEVKILTQIDDDEDEAELTYKYQEKLPHSLDPWTNNYELKSFIYTDGQVQWDKQKVYCIEGKNYIFH